MIIAIIQRRVGNSVSALSKMRQPAAYDPFKFKPRQPDYKRHGLHEISRFASISKEAEMTQQAHKKTIILNRLTFAMHGYQDESNPIKADKPLSTLLVYQKTLVINLV